MVRRRNVFPDRMEIVIGTVKTVNPYSVFVRLDEYGRDGMIHVSEVARKWVRDIRSFVKENDIVVCTVMNIDEEKGHVSLSMKRVSDGDRNRRLQQWKRDQKGEKLLEKMAAMKNITLDKAYEEIGFDIQDSFRDMLEAFEIAQRDPVVLERKGIDKAWIDLIKKTAEENIEIKELEIKGVLEATLYESDAIDTLKETFKTASEKYGINVRYISAPKYGISYTTKDPKKGDKLVNSAADEIMKTLRKQGAEVTFKMERA